MVAFYYGIRMDNKEEKEPINNDIAILPISSIATSLNVHQRTLRIYDEEGILRPKRSSKNRRVYSLNDLEKARAILFLTRNLAINLSGVKIILAMLEQNKINPKDYKQFIKNIAKIAKIDIIQQEANVKKTSKKGRKPKS